MKQTIFSLPENQKEVDELIRSWSLEQDLEGLKIAVLSRPKSRSYWLQVLALLKLGASPVLLHDQVKDLCLYGQHFSWDGQIWESTLSLSAKGKKDPSFISKIIFFTSGSQGTPTPIIHNLDSLIQSANSTNEFYQLLKSDCYPVTLPMNHVGGLMIPIRNGLRGSTTIFQEDIPFLEFIKKERPQILSVVPTQLKDLLTIEAIDFKVIIVGGAKTSDELAKNARDKGLPISLTYGMTETAAQIAATVPGEDNSAMLLLPGKKISIENELLILTEGPLAEATLKNHQIIKFSSPFQTKDLGQFENDRLSILGRKDEVYISGGENISPRQVEELIERNWPGSMAKIIAVDDDRFGQVGMLFSQLKIPYSSFKKSCQSFLQDYQIPKHMRPLPSIKDGAIKINQAEFQNLAKKKTRVVFLHGFMGDKNDWDSIIDQLPTEYGFEYISYNLPFHGKSVQKELSSFFKRLKKENPDPFFLVGYSMGGRVALEFALKNPTFIKGLFLESMNPGIEDKKVKEERYQNDLNLFKDKPLKEFLDKWFALDLFKGIKDHPGYTALLEKRLKGDVHSWQQSLTELSPGIRPNLWPELDQLKVPTFYLSGQDDQKYAAIAEQLKDHHGIETCCLKDASHNVHFLRPQEYIRCLEKFLLENQ